MGLLIGSFACGPSFHHSISQVPHASDEARHLLSRDTILLPAGQRYHRSQLHTFFYGKHYRVAWTTPVKIKVIDLKEAKGGLRPLKKGGSRQTLNLRVVNPGGVEYVLRSVEKEPTGGLPHWLRNSYVADIIRDATSATHPFASLTVPPMAEALHIYATKPELVYIPHTPNLGRFYQDFAGTLAMLERRPDGIQTDEAYFGYAPQVKSTKSMLQDRFGDNDVQVAPRHFLRARLFDILIGDWSRHEDNWRWSRFDSAASGILYKAVSRDRDNIFYKLNDAPVPWLFMKLGFKEHFQTFRASLEKPETLNRSGRNLDELLLAELSLSDWLAEADSVHRLLTDQVIEEAFEKLPDTIYTLTAPPIIEKLKSRRDQLPLFTRQYYHILARQVSLTGTDKHEEFVITHLAGGKVQVEIYKIKKGGTREKLLMARVFEERQTNRISFYGLAGDDRFNWSGSHNSRIALHFYGGAGDDSFSDQAAESRKSKKLFIPDSSYGNTFPVNSNARIDLNDNPAAQTLDTNGAILKYYLD